MWTDDQGGQVVSRNLKAAEAVASCNLYGKLTILKSTLSISKQTLQRFREIHTLQRVAMCRNAKKFSRDCPSQKEPYPGLRTSVFE